MVAFTICRIVAISDSFQLILIVSMKRGWNYGEYLVRSKIVCTPGITVLEWERGLAEAGVNECL